MTLEEKWKWFEEHNPWLTSLEEPHNKAYRLTDFGYVDLEHESVAFDMLGKVIMNSWDPIFNLGVEVVSLEIYFKDWKAPTEKEKLLFEMLHGVVIPWSEEHPLLFPES